MTDDKLTAARRALTNIADIVTEAIMHGTPTNAWEILVSIRELAQDAAEATLDTVETRT